MGRGETFLLQPGSYSLKGLASLAEACHEAQALCLVLADCHLQKGAFVLPEPNLSQNQIAFASYTPLGLALRLAAIQAPFAD